METLEDELNISQVARDEVRPAMKIAWLLRHRLNALLAVGAGE